MFRDLNNFFRATTFALVAIILFSCNNIQQDTNITQNTVIGNETSSNAYIVISTEKNSRTILPKQELEFEDFDTITLTGAPAGQTEEMLATWVTDSDSKACEKMNGTRIPIDAKISNWNFTLTVTKGKKILKGSLSKTISEGANKLDFMLNFVRSDTGKGDINVSLKYTDEDEIIKGVKAGLFEITNLETPVAGYGQDILSITKENGEYTVTYNKTNVPSAKYMLIFSFYTDTACTKYINEYREIIHLADGFTSEASRTINDFAIWHINYVMNGTEFDTVNPFPASFTRNDKVTLANTFDMAMNGTILLGWYETADFYGDAITEIPAGTTTDKTLYAKTLEGYPATKNTVSTVVNTYGADTPADAPTIRVFGETDVRSIKPSTTKYFKLDLTDTINLKYFRSTNLDVSFKNYNQLTGIIFPEGLESLSGFEGCGNLVSVTIPSSVKVFGADLFYGCISLDNPILPEGMTKIPKGMFAYCKGLKTINIPSTVTEIEGSVFFGCESLETITIPSNVKTIGNNTFGKCTNLKSLDLPEGITSIANSLFYSCENLETLVIPETVTSIGNNAFYECKNLENITIPENVTSIGEGAFYLCLKFTNITIPNKVTSISARTFSACQNITSITIPENISSIGEEAFDGCTKLTSIEIPSTVQSIGNSAFARCESITRLVIPEGVQSIGNYTIANCINLESVSIPSTIKTIGNYAFNLCAKLENIPIPDIVTSIGEGAFYGCSKLNNVTLPEGLTTIKRDAFCYCESIESVNIPSTVTTIGDYAFSCCNKLTNVTISEGISKISGNMFSCCYVLESITIPNSVTLIDEMAFYSCQKLRSITIQNPTVSIKERAFESCKNLENVFYGGTLENWCNLQFVAADGNPMSCAKKLYLNGDTNPITEITFPNTITQIGDYQFLGCSTLESITIPSTVTSIGKEAFKDCSNLKIINIPEGITSISESTFYNCSNMETIHIPESVTSIGENAFRECKKLESITLPDSISSIGRCAFEDCSALKNINLPEGIISIASSIFSACKSLESITIPSTVTEIESSAFFQCGLISITIPANVTLIECYAISCPNLTTVIFEDANGWWYGILPNSTSGTDIDVSSPETNATNLKNLSGAWCNKYLFKGNRS